MKNTKQFLIPKQDVYNAWLQVKKNKGSHGIDNITIEKYESNLKNNLYKLWNAMSSGTYFPKKVRNVEIPKDNKSFRILGIPIVNDRIAQTVVAKILNTIIDPSFHPDSFGFRPGKSTHQALELTKERCFDKPYVINLDIKGLFDNIPHDYIYKALDKFDLEKWTILYIKRWLEISDADNTKRGTPQGGVVSPILANLFMHFCFDMWMSKNHGNVKFVRYADDIVIHCVSEKQIKFILSVTEQRLNKCGIELNSDKTRLCNTKTIKSDYVKFVTFDFLGYTFKPAKARNKKTKECFTTFLPTISTKSSKKINSKINKSRLLKLTHLELKEIAKLLNPKIRGWCNYYGYFNPRSMLTICHLIDNKIAKYFKRKYKNIKSHGKAYLCVRKLKKQNPDLFHHWNFVRY